MKHLLLALIINCFSGTINAQKHGFLLIEPSINKKTGKSVYPGFSIAAGSRISNSLIHLGFGASALFSANEKISLFAVTSIVDDKATKVSPILIAKFGNSGYYSLTKAGSTNIIVNGRFYFLANAGVVFPSKIKGKIVTTIGFGRTNYLIKSGSTETKSSSNSLNFSFALKIQ